MNGERCRYENSEREVRERRRLERRREECAEQPWWDPRRWVCSVVVFIEEAWTTVVQTVLELVCTAVETIEEISRIASTIVRAVAMAVDNVVGVVTGRNTTGYWPIVDSVTRDVPSVPRLSTSTRSIALLLQPIDAATVHAYDEEGIHVEIELDANGRPSIRTAGTSTRTLGPTQADYPAFAPTAVAPAVSYDTARLGTWLPDMPRLDMVAAGGDRLIGKVAGSDAIYILLLAHPYVHRPVSGPPLHLPQSFFKLDPEAGRSDSNPSHRLLHLAVPGDDERHLATDRFPLFRWLFGTSTNLVRPSIDLMVMWFAPMIWTKIDARPRRDTHDPPRGYPTYDHVVYRSNLPRLRIDTSGPIPLPRMSTAVTRKSIRYRRVLDLAVGVSHLHEQYTSRFGGEANSLAGRGGVFGEAFSGARSWLFGSPHFMSAYQYANGAIADYGGWLDGTCIYYMLVQLKTDAEIAAGKHRDAYAVLWADEQFAFTERWRLLHIYEREFTSPFQPIVGEISFHENEYHPGHPFEGDRYFCPMQLGHLRSWSRMVATRQHVVVSGIAPETDRYELYSIHWAWGTMDKTWRRRPLPAPAVVAGDLPLAPHVDLSTLSLRGDATLMLAGAQELDGAAVPGYWTQPLLPCDGQETPSVAQLRAEPRFAGRRSAYVHPWRFVAAQPATTMHRAFSHFGVLESVDSRVQCYLIGKLEVCSPEAKHIESLVWEDVEGALRNSHRRLDYAALSRFLDGQVAPSSPTVSPEEAARTVQRLLSGRIDDIAGVTRLETRPSRYHLRARLRLRYVPQLGWIAMWADKRDDKNAPLDAIDRPVRLQALSDPTQEIVVADLTHVRSEVDPHGATVGLEPDGISPPAVRRAVVTVQRAADGSVVRVEIVLHLARSEIDRRHGRLADYDRWCALHIMHVKVATLVTGGVQMLLQVARTQQVAAAVEPTLQRFVWTPPAGVDQALLADRLTGRSSMLDGTSLWCVGATGLVAVPDEVHWA